MKRCVKECVWLQGIYTKISKGIRDRNFFTHQCRKPKKKKKSIGKVCALPFYSLAHLMTPYFLPFPLLSFESVFMTNPT